MKKTFAVLVIFLLAAGSAVMYSQQNERKITENMVIRLQEDLDFEGETFSFKYKVHDPGTIWIDVDEKKRDAILYFNSHPVFRFKVRIVDHKSDKISIAGKEYVLTGNTDQRIIIDKGVGKIFIKKKERPAAVIKAPFSPVTFQKTPVGKIRFVITKPGNMSVKIHNNRGKKINADFYMKGIFTFSMEAKYLKVRGKVNNIVWLMKSDIGDELALNSMRKILYYRSGHPRGTWAKLEEIK